MNVVFEPFDDFLSVLLRVLHNGCAKELMDFFSLNIHEIQ
jgi:hypothetical protein